MSSAKAPGPDPTKPTLYVVATVHLDTQWRWTIQDTIRNFIPATLERNFELLERHPFFIVSFEGAFRYQLMQEYYPELFERLREWISRGRWRLAGSMLDAPDVNTVAPESLLRHILYGNGYFQREFGRRSVDLFLPDCFGFGHALPSVAAHCGLLGFSGQKFGRWMAPATIPFDVGVWQGPDGGEIVAAIRPEGYGEGLDEDLSRASRFLERLQVTGGQCGAAVGLKYVGVGDRGGGLDDTSVEWLERSVRSEGPIEVVLSGSDQLFRDLEPQQVASLPRHRSELLLPTHGTGCLTSQAQLKRWNRRNEMLADAAERAAVMSALLAASPYPADTLREAWTRFLWHQMHDDLTGTSIPAAYRFTDNDEVLSLNQFAQVLTHSLGALASRMDTRCRGEPVLVFNPLSIERRDWVELDLPRRLAGASELCMVGPDGVDRAVQIIRGANGQPAALFLARVPPLGLQVYDLQSRRPEASADCELQITADSLANRRYLIRLDERGDVASIIDRCYERSLLRAPIQLQLLRDRSARWPAWEILYDDLLDPEPRSLGGPAHVRILERGPVRISIGIERTSHRSSFLQIVRLSAGEAGERIEIDHHVDWRTRGRMLKANFPTAFSNPQAVYDLGLGVIERGNNQRQKYEVPAQQWAALPDVEGRGGITLLNDCKYGWDKPDDQTLRQTLLRSPRVIRKFRHQGNQDHGRHRFTLGIYSHRNDWQYGDSSWQAARLNQPLMPFHTSDHDGPLGREVSLAEISRERVAIQALKLAENGRGWVVRLRELSGRSVARTSIRLPVPIERARRVDGMEEDLGSVEPDRDGFSVELPPFGIRSYVFDTVPTENTAPNSSGNRALTLAFDRVATRYQGVADSRGFDGAGHSIPAELWPSKLRHGGIEFPLGPGRDCRPSALRCRGQRLELGAHSCDRVHLLATSIRNPVTGLFCCGDQQAQVAIGRFTGFLGGRPARPRLARLTGLGRPTVLGADHPVAWVFTHRIDADGRAEPYVFCYLYCYCLEISRGCEFLQLPARPEINLFAAILSNDRTCDTRPLRALYD